MSELNLKDVIKCECGFVMFPYEIHKEEDTILYKCSASNCNCSKLLPFKEATLKPGEINTYFLLDDSGNMFWKCPLHGKCQDNLKWLSSEWEKNVNKFIDYGCGYEVDYDEVEDALEDVLNNLDEHKREICELFEPLSDEDIVRVANEMGIELEEEYPKAFLDYFKIRQEDEFIFGQLLTWENYFEKIIHVMVSLDLL